MFLLVTGRSVAYIQLGYILVLCLQASAGRPPKHLLGSCPVHLLEATFPGCALPVFLEVEMIPKLKFFQMFQYVTITFQPPQIYMSNGSLSLYLKFFTLLELREHSLCGDGGRVWNILFLSLFLVILYKIPPFSSSKMQIHAFLLQWKSVQGIQDPDIAVPQISVF